MDSTFSPNFEGVARTLGLVLVLTVVVLSVTGPALAVQDGNETTQTTENTSTPTATETPTQMETETPTDSPTPTPTPAPTETDAACEPGADEPSMDQARLFASDTTIESGSPGRIDGGFQVDPTANCPVVVFVTMSVPSGMSISGGSDFASGGAGMVSARFTVRPGANIQDVSANVYSDEVGQKTVTANIQYWPEGHQELSRDIDGLSFTFEIEEATTPTAAGQSGDGGISNGFGSMFSSSVLVIGALLLTTLVAIKARL